jgi:hypothetical protein
LVGVIVAIPTLWDLMIGAATDLAPCTIIVIAIVGVTVVGATIITASRAPYRTATSAATTAATRCVIGHRSLAKIRSTMALNKAHLKTEEISVNLAQGHGIRSGHDRCDQRIKLFEQASEEVGHNFIIAQRCASSRQGVSKCDRNSLEK